MKFYRVYHINNLRTLGYYTTRDFAHAYIMDGHPNCSIEECEFTA